jgi:hypothetical protein
MKKRTNEDDKHGSTLLNHESQSKTLPSPDFFWGKTTDAKVLIQPKIRLFPDGSARKGRHLTFNPFKPDLFATSSNDGELILWNYVRQKQEILMCGAFDPKSFRKESACAEAMAWSPEGHRLALAFRDAMDGVGEFAIVKLDQLPLPEGNKRSIIPSERIITKRSSLHSRYAFITQYNMSVTYS